MTILDAKKAHPREGGPSFSLFNRLYRLVWKITWCLLCSWTPGPFNFWRCIILRLFGATIAPTAHIYGSAKVWAPCNLIVDDFACLGPSANCYNMAMISLKPHATVSQGAYLCAGSHNIDDPDFQLVAQPIIIGENAWVAAEAFVGPNVVIEKGAVLGARGVTFHKLDSYKVYAGNPAKYIKDRMPESG